MRHYGCRSCVTRFCIEKQASSHTTHAAFCPFCGSASISDLSVKSAAAVFARRERRAGPTREMTGVEL